MFGVGERLLALRFALHLGDSVEDLTLVMPATFGSALVQAGEGESGRSGAEDSMVRRLESRLLQCVMTVSVDLCGNVVPLGELVALQVGSRLDLRTPVDTPIQLRVDGHALFDVTPVKHGRYKAAQMVQASIEEE